MVFRKKFAPRHGSSPLKLILGIIIIVLIIAAIVLALHNPITTVASSATFALANNQSAYFKLAGNDNTYVVFLLSSSNSSATLYITGTPVLVRPVSAATLNVAESANVSGDGTQTADMQVKLISTKAGSVQIEITPIPSSIQIKPSNFVSLLYPALPNSAGSAPATSITTTATTTAGSTTIVASGQTTTQATSATTTVQQQIPTLAVMQIVNGSTIGGLMQAYNKLYIKDQACTSGAYNVTFNSYHHFAPSGPETFENVSPGIPLQFGIKIVSTGTNIYNVSYTPQLPSGQIVPATIIITANSASNSVPGYAFLDKGLNYTSYNNEYQLQNGFTNVCGAYIT